MFHRFFSLLLLACALGPLHAEPDPAVAPAGDERAALASGLQWKTGKVALQGGTVALNLPESLRYLDKADAQTVLHRIWGNPENPSTLGMIFPRELGPLDRASWAVVISYEDQGYMKDDEADKINYTELLAQMQKETLEGNAEREKEGYPPIKLLGWAAPPHYDKEAHKLYWAKELQFGNSSESTTLNYDIRILGRRGWLVMQVISDVKDLPVISAQIPALLQSVEFQPGNLYADFDPKIDKIAEYGLATLVAGGALGAAAKLGFLGLIWKYLLIGVLFLKKFVIVAVIAAAAGVKKLINLFMPKKAHGFTPPPNPPTAPPG